VRGLLSTARVIPVLCYHKVERRHELGVTRLSPRRFASQMESLARAGWRAIALSEFTATVRGERPAGDRELLITFDDAYRGLRDHAFPVLRDLGFAAACFVITDYAGRLNRWDVAYGGRRFAHLAWRDMERWSARGLAFASHTATHPRLPGLDDRALADELSRSRDAIEKSLGIRPTAIAYPFGALDARVATAATQSGYSLGFTLGRRWDGDAMRVPRAAVHCWSPRLPVVGPLGALEQWASQIACRCSVGTTVWHRLTSHPTPRHIVPSSNGMVH
jgi:peptidoglycan/xylan/chitin deacetylase (PgdA/CDA1 family)